MIQAPDLPGWAALLVGLLVLAGAVQVRNKTTSSS